MEQIMEKFRLMNRLAILYALDGEPNVILERMIEDFGEENKISQEDQELVQDEMFQYAKDVEANGFQY